MSYLSWNFKDQSADCLVLVLFMPCSSEFQTGGITAEPHPDTSQLLQTRFSSKVSILACCIEISLWFSSVILTIQLANSSCFSKPQAATIQACHDI